MDGPAGARIPFVPTHRLEDGTQVVPKVHTDGKPVAGAWVDAQGNIVRAPRADPIKEGEINAVWTLRGVHYDVAVVGAGREPYSARLADGQEVSLWELEFGDNIPPEVVTVMEAGPGERRRFPRERRRWDTPPQQGSRAAIEWAGGNYVWGVVTEPLRESADEVVVTVIGRDGWHHEVRKLFRFHSWHPLTPGPRKWLRAVAAVALSALPSLVLYRAIFRADFLHLDFLLQAAIYLLAGFFLGKYWVREDVHPSVWDWIIIVPAILLVLSVTTDHTEQEVVRRLLFMRF